MCRGDHFDRIVQMTHKAALGDVPWTVPASMINESIRTHANNLVVYEGRSQSDIEFSLVRSCYGTRRRKDVEERYLKHFFHQDEAIPRVMALPYGRLTATGQLYTEQEKKTSPVFNGSRRIRNGLYVRLDGLGESNTVWSIADSTEPGGGWSSTQTRLIEHLLPHVRQFARVRCELADARALSSSFGELLVNSRFGVILLDRRARIVAANDLAHGLLRQFGGLCDRGGFLNASRVAEDDALQRLLARALPQHAGPGSADSMTIGRPDTRTRLVVHITPMAERAWDPRAQRVAALVLVADPESRPRIDAGLVAKVLDLTPAEGRLATMVAAGRTVRDIAEVTGHTEAAVRRHLKEVLRKQDISRQADLVRLVLSLDNLPWSRRWADGPG